MINLLIALAALQPSGDDAGKKQWISNCSSCHAVPDPALKLDQLWLEMIQTTA